MSPTTIPGNLILQSPTANDPLLDLNTQPSLDLQFATSKTLDDRVSGSPLVDHQRDVSSGKSAGTYVGSDGLIKNSAVNLVTYSQDFTNSYWSGNSDVTANTDVAPDGSLTASTYSSNGAQLASSFIPITSNTNYTSSIYIKKTTGRTYTAGLTLNYDAGVQYGILLNTNDGTTSPGSFTVPTVAVSSAGNFWRISLTANSGSTVNVRVYLYPNLNSSAATAAGQQVIWGAQLEEGSTASPYIKTTNLPSAAPRFDHDPTTNASLGLLVEESRTNFLTNSEHLDTGWLYQGSMVAPTTTTVKTPDGDLDARLFTSSGGRVRQDKTSAAAIYTLSVYYKPNTDTTLQLFLFNSGSQANVTFDTTNPSNPTVTSGSGVMVDAGDGWFRASVTTSAATDGTVIESMIYTDSGYIWGAQLEAGAFPTSYIPTSGSTVPRAADVVSITGSNFSRWYEQSEGTLFVDFDLVGHSGSDTFIFGINAGNTTTGKGIQVYTSTTGIVALYQSDNLSLRPYIGALGGANTPSKATYAYSSNGIYGSLDGGAVAGRVLTSPLPVEDTLYLGRIGGLPGIYSQYGHISRLTYYPYRLPDATLQEITS